MADKITHTSLTFGINEHTFVDMECVIEMTVNVEQAKSIIATYALCHAMYDEKIEENDEAYEKLEKWEPGLEGILINGYDFTEEGDHLDHVCKDKDGYLYMEGNCMVACFNDGDEIGVEDSDVLVSMCIDLLNEAGEELPEEAELLEDYIKNGDFGDDEDCEE